MLSNCSNGLQKTKLLPTLLILSTTESWNIIKVLNLTYSGCWGGDPKLRLRLAGLGEDRSCNGEWDVFFPGDIFLTSQAMDVGLRKKKVGSRNKHNKAHSAKPNWISKSRIHIILMMIEPGHRYIFVSPYWLCTSCSVFYGREFQFQVGQTSKFNPTAKPTRDWIEGRLSLDPIRQVDKKWPRFFVIVEV